MTPVIERLQSTLGDQSFQLGDPNPLKWTFSEQIKERGLDFYQKIIPSHLVINVEYSLLGQQIRSNIASQQVEKKELIIAQIVSALLLAEILEQTYQKYLIVPREVKRMREQQELYRQILNEFQDESVIESKTTAPVSVGLSFSQEVRAKTFAVNLYRLLFLRGKRALDLIAMTDFSADWYRRAIGSLDKCTDPLIPHLGWFFYLPRLLINFYLTGLHLIPGPWMSKEERDLGWWLRFQTQLQRRWFELANDTVWVIVGAVNCFILTGALIPVATYLAIVFFAYDVVVSAIRVYIELNRLYELKKQYENMLVTAINKKELEDHITVLNKQIDFEMLRFGTHFLSAIGISLAMCCSAPLFALNPLIPLIGALCLAIICIINLALVPVINHYRPQDIIEAPSGVAKLGIFAKPKNVPVESPPALDHEPEPDFDASDEKYGGFCCSQ